MTKTSDAINALTGPSPLLNDEQCIRIYDAVTRRNFTRDVKTDADKCATVRQAQLGCTPTGPAEPVPLPRPNWCRKCGKHVSDPTAICADPCHASAQAKP